MPAKKSSAKKSPAKKYKSKLKFASGTHKVMHCNMNKTDAEKKKAAYIKKGFYSEVVPRAGKNCVTKGKKIPKRKTTSRKRRA